MEPKHKELLEQFHQNLLDSITDADRLIELLVISGTLSQLDRFELDQNCSSSAEKVDQLLKMLVNKESDHFLELCVALEKAYPDLYSALFTNGGGPVDHSSGKAPCTHATLLHANVGCMLATFLYTAFEILNKLYCYPKSHNEHTGWSPVQYFYG